MADITFKDLKITKGPDLIWDDDVGATSSTSASGGGVKIVHANNINFEGCLITGNTAGQDGGGVYCKRSFVTFTNTDITNNKARDAGAGLFLQVRPAIAKRARAHARARSSIAAPHASRPTPRTLP